MIAKLTVILFIFLCLMVGVFLTLMPWVNMRGFVDWGDNYFLNYLTYLTGWTFIKQSVGSGWVRGAVTGLGVLNLILAFWEISHFGESVEELEKGDAAGTDKRLNVSEK